MKTDRILVERVIENIWFQDFTGENCAVKNSESGGCACFLYHAVACLPYYLTLKMEEIISSET
jgi:hypothetical protein